MRELVGFGDYSPLTSSEREDLLDGCPGGWIFVSLSGDSFCLTSCPSDFYDRQYDPSGEKWCFERSAEYEKPNSYQSSASSNVQAALSVEDSGIKLVLAAVIAAGIAYLVIKP